MKQFAQAAVGSIGKQEQPQYQPPSMREPVQVRQDPGILQQSNDIRPVDGPSGLDDIINQMNLNPNEIPDLDSISLMSQDVC